MTDKVYLTLNPDYYTKHNLTLDGDREISPYDIFANQSFALGNVGKYLLRYKNKNGLEDLQKAVWYLKQHTSWQERIDAEEEKFSDYEYELELNNLSKANPLMEAYITLLRTDLDNSYYRAAENLENLIREEITKLTYESMKTAPIDFYYYVTTFNSCVKCFIEDTPNPSSLSISSDLEGLYDYQKQVTRLHMMHQAKVSHEDKEYQETLTKIVLFMQSVICAFDIGMLSLAGIIAGSLKDITKEEIKEAQNKALSICLSAEEFDKEGMEFLANTMANLLSNDFLPKDDIANLNSIKDVICTNFIQRMLDCLSTME